MNEGMWAVLLARGALRRWWLLLALALVIPGACVASVTTRTSPTTTAGFVHDPVMVAVERVRDGDTLEVSGFGAKREAVRLIGVDTPETVHPSKPPQCYGPQASAYTKRLLPPGSTVRLVFERDANGRGLRDRHKRLLAYVHKGRVFLNLRLVERGYAKATYFAPNDDHRSQFDAAQKKAKAAKRGLWGACASSQPTATTGAALATCAQVKAAGKGPYRKGVDPEYARYEDRDGDGVVCE